MPLFASEVYDAFRAAGVPHEPALAAAVALYAAPREPSPPGQLQRVERCLTVLIALDSFMLGLLLTILFTLTQR